MLYGDAGTDGSAGFSVLQVYIVHEGPSEYSKARATDR